MERDERRRADALDHYWDAVQRGARPGGSKDLDQVAAAIIDQIANTPQEPGTSAAQLKVRQRIVAAASAKEKPMSTTILLDPVSSASPPLWRPTRDARAGLAPRIAIAALLLLTLGLGYVFIGPGQSDDTPRTIPAAVLATEDATPEDESEIPVNQWSGHPIVGTWQIDNDPTAPGTNISLAVFEGLGRYQEIEPDGRIIYGSWRPISDTEVEVIFVVQSLVRQDLFASDSTPVPNAFAPGMEVWRLTNTVDEYGNTLTSTGTFESYAADGSLEYTSDYQGTGLRMTTITTDAATTPNP